MTEVPPPRVSMEDLRPRSLDGIVGQTATVARLRRIALGVRARRIAAPNLLFHGPPGVGKTTAARAFAREVLGEEWENSFNELNAADERGVGFVRDKILPLLRRPPARGALVRILFFDEAEGLGPEVQSALRPALEGEAATCMFILACNDLEAISLPVRSRCAVLEFSPLEPEEMRRAVSAAFARTPFEFDDARVDSIVARAHGIPREAIKLLIEEQGGAE